MIVRHLVSHYAQHCAAIHCTMFLCPPPMPTLKNILQHPLVVTKFLLGATLLGFDSVYGKGKFRMNGKNFADIINDPESGYRAIQGTRPYSLSYGLADSPVGLLGKTDAYSNSNNKRILCYRMDVGKVSQLDTSS